MKIAAIVDNGTKNVAFYTDFICRIKAQAGADAVAVIMDGVFLASGIPAAESPELRAEKLRDAGAELVIEMPVHGVLLKHDTYVYVLAMLMQKLGCVDVLVLPCEAGSEPVILDAASTMLLAPREYQQALMGLKKDRELEDAVLMAVSRFVPGASSVLSVGMNRMAADARNALRLSYCSTKTELMGVEWQEQPDAILPDADALLGNLLRRKLETMDDAALGDIFGSTDGLVRVLRSCAAEELTFTETAKSISRYDFSQHSARLYLLRVLLDFRHISHSMCALHSYIFYIRVLAWTPGAAAEALRAGAGTELVWGSGEDRRTETEQRAEKLMEMLY